MMPDAKLSNRPAKKRISVRQCLRQGLQPPALQAESSPGECWVASPPLRSPQVERHSSARIGSSSTNPLTRQMDHLRGGRVGASPTNNHSLAEIPNCLPHSLAKLSARLFERTAQLPFPVSMSCKTPRIWGNKQQRLKLPSATTVHAAGKSRDWIALIPWMNLKVTINRAEQENL